jgi:hypothetical protein
VHENDLQPAAGAVPKKRSLIALDTSAAPNVGGAQPQAAGPHLTF